MSTKIRLMRLGKIRTPYFRIVVTDSRKARNGLSIEEIGRYVPGQDPSIIEVNSERAQYWLGVGAQPSEAVTALFKITGDWQKHKGLPGAEGTLKVAAPKSAKSVAYEAAVKAAAAEPMHVTNEEVEEGEEEELVEVEDEEELEEGEEEVAEGWKEGGKEGPAGKEGKEGKESKEINNNKPRIFPPRRSGYIAWRPLKSRKCPWMEAQSRLSWLSKINGRK